MQCWNQPWISSCVVEFSFNSIILTFSVLNFIWAQNSDQEIDPNSSHRPMLQSTETPEKVDITSWWGRPSEWRNTRRTTQLILNSGLQLLICPRSKTLVWERAREQKLLRHNRENWRNRYRSEFCSWRTPSFPFSMGHNKANFYSLGHFNIYHSSRDFRNTIW